jgi:hypothetical protein
MLTLHETVLLFALHDDRGTVHSRAWIGLDDALRGAVAAEWMLRGTLTVDRAGLCTWADRVAGSPLLDGLRDEIAPHLRTTTFEIDALLSALQAWTPSLRGRVERCLVLRGTLQLGAIDRHELEDTTTLHARGPEETAMLAHLAEAIRRGPEMRRRMGMLIGLVHALDLWPVLLPPTERAAAREAGAWVLQRDALIQAVERRVLARSGLEA